MCRSDQLRVPAPTGSSRRTSLSASRGGNNALLLLLNSAAAGSVLHNRMTAQFANLSVELTSRPPRHQIRKAADKKEIIGNGGAPNFSPGDFSEVTARERADLEITCDPHQARWADAHASRQRLQRNELGGLERVEIFLSSTISQTTNSRGCIIFGAKCAFMQCLGIWNSVQLAEQISHTPLHKIHFK